MFKEMTEPKWGKSIITVAHFSISPNMYTKIRRDVDVLHEMNKPDLIDI